MIRDDPEGCQEKNKIYSYIEDESGYQHLVFGSKFSLD